MFVEVGSKVKFKSTLDTERHGIVGVVGTVVALYPFEERRCIVETGAGPENRYHTDKAVLERVAANSN